MKFGIVQETNLSNEQVSWIYELSEELKLYFKDRSYGEGLKELFFRMITVKPEFDFFFKKRRPRYRPGKRSERVNGVEIKCENEADIECKIEYEEIKNFQKAELLRRVSEELLVESNALTRLSRLKDFDFQSYKSDLENYLIEKKYIESKKQ